MVSRRIIIQGKQYVHVITRCHDRNFFMEPIEIKQKILLLFATYIRRYGLKVYEFIIMDNHYHFLMETPNAEALSNFMRTVNSRLATIINSRFERDSQALRERFKSPVIHGRKYFLKVMQYIWLNRKEADSSNHPDKDKFNSLSWRINGKSPILFENPDSQALIDNFLTEYKDCGIALPNDDVHFIRSLFNKGLKKLSEVMDLFMENFHTIADEVSFRFRQELMNAHRRQQAPPGYTTMLNKSSPLKTI